MQYLFTSIYQVKDTTMNIARVFGYSFLAFCFLSLVGIPASNGEESVRVQALEMEVKNLKATVDRLSKPTEQSDFDIPRLQLRGFGFVQHDFESRDVKNGSGSVTSTNNTNNFTNGGIDLFITSKIARKFNFLSETLMDYDRKGNTFVEVERALVRYEYADWLNVTMGRGHTSFGYWNQRFHHANWLATTTDRPILYRFEDQGGILPLHYAGLEFSGNLNLGIGELTYSGNVANGRGRIFNEVQMVKDDNASKQVNFMFTLEPSAIKGFGFGANILHDVIPGDPNVVGRGHEIEEVIGGVHAFYLDDKIELIAEYQMIQHDSDVSKFHSGGYLQSAYTFRKLKPYYRFDFLDIKAGDLFFAGVAGVEDTRQHTVGIRFDVFPFASLKVEFRRADADTFRSTATAAQMSFAF